MQFAYEAINNWPALAWLARLSPGADSVEVRHGPRVEVCRHWFCEAVWAGDFGQGDFDLTERVFGSGARFRDDAITFVTSGSTCDRLHWIEIDGATWISNSLPCLMTSIGATVDPTFDRYYQFFGSVVCGLNRYARQLQTSAGAVNVTYFNNLRWQGQRLLEIEKPHTANGFGTYEDYRAFLDDSMEQLSRNLRSPLRAHPFRMLGTMSSGYDSATVATLASRFGLTEVIAFSPSRNGWPDSGDAVANALGLNLKIIPRNTWRGTDSPEHLFIVADAKGQDIFFHGARELLEGSVLLTGYSGDMTWDYELAKVLGQFAGCNGPAPIHGEMLRGDRSGLSHSEYRLHVGYIHCPIPYLGARHLPDIDAITHSDAMKPWHTGGKYSRPIPRRIIEEFGVARDAFGQYKRGSSVLWFEKTGLHSDGALKEYNRWLKSHWRDFLRCGKFPPHLGKRILGPLQSVARFGWAIHHRTHSWPAPLRWVSGMGQKLGEFSRKEYFGQYMFAWALERALEHYATPATTRATIRPTAPIISASAA
jgi:hypothetical protein